jgi:hypothetical protein
MVKPRRFCVGAMAFLVVVGLWASGCDSGKTAPQKQTSSNVPAPPSPPPPSPTPVASPVTGWEPSPTALDDLEPYQDVAGYQIRVPKGWIASTAEAAPGQKAFVWYGTRPNDNKGAVLRLMVIEAPKPTSSNYEEFKKATADSALDEFLRSARSGGFITTNKEAGQINGISFARVNAAIRKEADGGYVVQGTTYFGKDDLVVVMLMFNDEESHYTESAKLGISAILTFRKKP